MSRYIGGQSGILLQYEILRTILFCIRGSSIDEVTLGLLSEILFHMFILVSKEISINGSTHPLVRDE